MFVIARRKPIVWAFLCLFSRSCTQNNQAFVFASDDATDIKCPGPDEAFITTCSGSENKQQHQQREHQQQHDFFGESDHESGASEQLEQQQQHELFDESNHEFEASDLVDEVLEDSKDDHSHSKQQTATNEDWEVSSSSRSCSSNDDSPRESIDPDDAITALQQLKHTTDRLVRRYYDPLPRQGKCAIGSICGFAASRISLGVANRIFRLGGATWVLSEVLHSSGFCDETKCVPEEARPWISILRRMLIRQCIKVRLAARKLWNKEMIREIAQRDEVLSGGFAAGAFIGFVV
ncbi:hypothetical protein ACHAXA_007556 [Cyclostephanos tholiformis]|uniref:Uncharacterized protein n=1 Tax=Cyclostephanos tholiformis TaxID=382380 RepID=A0ABD3SR11_9STRA